jgi:hypothetical protein
MGGKLKAKQALFRVIFWVLYWFADRVTAAPPAPTYAPHP